MRQSAGASALSLPKRLKKLCTYAVLGSFVTNILVPSYAFATADVMVPDDPLRRMGVFHIPSVDRGGFSSSKKQTNPFRTGILLRTSSIPFRIPTYPIKPKQHQSLPVSSIQAGDSPTLPEAQLTHDAASDFDAQSGLDARSGLDAFSDQASDVASQQADYSDDESEYGSSEAESDVSDVTALDDLWDDPRYAVPDQPNTLRFAGVLFDCSAPGKVILSPDPQATDDERSTEFLHVFNPYGAAILDKVDQLTKSLYVEALGCEVKTDISVQSLTLKLINADGKKGTLTIAEGVKLKAEIASFEGVNIDNRGVLEIKDGTLHVGTFTDAENATTKLPDVTLDQKDAVVKGAVDIKRFTHSQGSESGQWSIEGQLMIHDGAFHASLAEVKGKLGLGGQLVNSTLYGKKAVYDFKDGKLNILSLYGEAPITREERKAYLGKIYEVYKPEIQTFGTADTHDYYKMLAWMTADGFVLQGPQRAWMIDEMLKNAGAWEWGGGRTASAEEMIYYKAFESQKKDVCRDIYEKNQKEIEQGGPKAWHGYYKMLHWLQTSMFLADNPGCGWLLEELEKNAGHWGWGAGTASPEESQLYASFFKGHKKELMKAFYDENKGAIQKSGSTKCHPYYQTLAWLKQERFAQNRLDYGWLLPEFIRDGGHWGFDKSGKTIASAEEMEALEGFAWQGRHRIGTLRVGTQGSVQALQGLSLHVGQTKNEGRIESLENSLRLFNTTKLDLGAIAMHNDELIVETDDDSDWVEYVKKYAPQWLAHRFRFKAPKMHLTHAWHFTCRNIDGTNQPFIWGEGPEVASVLESWQNKPNAEKILCSVVIDVVDFIWQPQNPERKLVDEVNPLGRVKLVLDP